MPRAVPRRTLLAGMALMPQAAAHSPPPGYPVPAELERQLAEAERKLLALDRTVDTAEARAKDARGRRPPPYAMVRIGNAPPCFTEHDIEARLRSGAITEEEAEQGLAEYRRRRQEIDDFRQRSGLAELDSERERLVAERDDLARALATAPAHDLDDVAAKLRRLVTISEVTTTAERRDLAVTALAGIERLRGWPT